MTLSSFAPRSCNLYRSIPGVGSRAATAEGSSPAGVFRRKPAAARRACLALGLLGWVAIAFSAVAQTAHSGGIVTLGSGFSNPYGVALDASGNVFVADYSNGAVKEILAVGGVVPSSSPTINTLGSGFLHPASVAVDSNGNVFVADKGDNSGANGAVKEILAAGGYSTVHSLGSGFSVPEGVALDSGGNVFVADHGNGAVKEILAAGGYTTVNTLGSGFSGPFGVAVDARGNVFVGNISNNTANRSSREVDTPRC